MPKNALRLAILAAAIFAFAPATANAQLTIEIKDYVRMPMTGLVDGKGSNDALLARVNTLREEPGGANRFCITDLNGPVYILDKDTRKFTTYLDFNGRDGHGGLFHKLFTEAGYGSASTHSISIRITERTASSTPSTSKMNRFPTGTFPITPGSRV